MVVHRPSDKPVSLLGIFGVAIKAIGANQRHVGMLYKLSSEVRLCHLAFYLDLRDELVGKSYCWAEAGLDESNRKLLAAQCARLAAGADKIPYGLAEQGISFDRSTGRYITAPGW